MNDPGYPDMSSGRELEKQLRDQARAHFDNSDRHLEAREGRLLWWHRRGQIISNVGLIFLIFGIPIAWFLLLFLR